SGNDLGARGFRSGGGQERGLAAEPGELGGELCEKRLDAAGGVGGKRGPEGGEGGGFHGWWPDWGVDRVEERRGRARSSAWGPDSAIVPFWRTRIWSASRAAERRWAMTITVLPWSLRLRMDERMRDSVEASRALVGSSSTRTDAPRSRARAIARR